MSLGVSLLLVSTLTTVGLLALALALAPGHWFVRTLAFLAPVSLLLLVPAYEPFLTLVIEGSVVAAGISLWRRAKARRTGQCLDTTARVLGNPQGPVSQASHASRGFRFRMSTVLCTMALCGIAAAIGARWQDDGLVSWAGIINAGTASGVATLLGAWAASRRWWWFIPTLATALLLSIAPAWCDGFDSALTMLDWTSSESSAIATWFAVRDLEGSWFLVIPAVALAAFVLVRLAGVIGCPETRHAQRQAAVAIAGGLILVLALPASYVLVRLLTPPLIPQVTLPQPNGRDELVAAGRLAENTLANSARFDADTAKLGELEQAAQEAEPALALARRALGHECAAPVNYSTDSLTNSLWTDSFQQFRCLARAMGATGKFHAARGEMDDALAAYLDIVHAGVQFSRGGLLIDGIVGCAVTGIGKADVYHEVHKLSSAQCRATIAHLQKAQLQFEPFQMFLTRDRIWTAHVYGWVGHANQIIDEWGDYYESDRFDYATPFNRERACKELLVAELALRAFYLEQQRTPASWDEVVAAGGPALVVDPFDPAGRPLRFVATDAGPVVYSVGPNGVDDSGQSLRANDHNWDPDEGDLRLDRLWPRPTAAGASAAGATWHTAGPEADGERDRENDPTDADVKP